MLLRWGQAEDFDLIGQVVFDAIHTGASLYSDPQRHAWMPTPPKGDLWHSRLADQHVALAEDRQVIHGIISLAPGGYVDFAYILTASRGQGLFRRLYAMIETRARAEGVTWLSTHASLMAQGPFSAVGFEVVQHETVERAGQQLKRAEMQKQLE